MGAKTLISKESWKKIFQLLFVLALYMIVGAIFFLIYHLSGFTLDDLKTWLGSIGIWAYIIFILLQILTNVLLFIIPGQTLQFIVLGLTLFSPLETFFLVLGGMVIASTINFLLGRLVGEKFVKKIIGEDTYDKYQNKLKTKAYIYYPLMMVLPFFPDDEITILAGLTKMNLIYFIITTVLTRSIGIAIFTFIPGQIVFTYKDPFELVMIIIGIIYIALLLIYLIRELERFISKIIK